MKVSKYQAWADGMRHRHKHDDYITYDVMGIAKEAGEVADAWSRNARGDYPDPDVFREDVLLELGDTFHYMVRLASDLGYEWEEVMAANVEKLTNREKYGKGKKGKRS